LNTSTLSDSLLLISLANIEKISKELQSNTLDLLLLFTTLSKVGIAGSQLTGNTYVLAKQGNHLNLNRVKSALLLHIVCEGISIHTPELYSNNPNTPWRSKIKVDDKYQQFLDTIYLLSEYNYNKDLLNKYLRLYQIVEDFMYKSSLVMLETQNNGNLFSIRDFKLMYEYVSEKEYYALLNLIESVFDEYYSPNVKFRQFIFTEFMALTSQLSQNDIDAILKKFKVKNPKTSNLYIYTSVTDKNIARVFAQLVYYIRNSIVHNKTTEYHLTYNSIHPEISTFIKTFMLPKLEIIIFFLTIESPSNLVRFINKELKIWDDN
jgi:hypothetical protein